MPTLGGVAYTEMRGSSAGQFPRDGDASRVKICKIAWADQDAFLAALHGSVTVAGDGYSVELPARYATGSQLFAGTATVEGVGLLGQDSSGCAQYQFAKITVQFVPLPSEDENHQADEMGGTWAEEHTRFWTDMIPLPGYGLKWQTSGLPLPADKVFAAPVTRGEIKLTRFKMGTLPRAAFGAALGKLCSDNFRGWGVHCLQFGGWDYSYSAILATNVRTYTVTATLNYRSCPWDVDFDPEGAIWDVVLVSDGSAIIASCEFGAL